MFHLNRLLLHEIEMILILTAQLDYEYFPEIPTNWNLVFYSFLYFGSAMVIKIYLWHPSGQKNAIHNHLCDTVLISILLFV